MDFVETILMIFGLEAVILLLGWLLALFVYRFQLISSQHYKIRRIQSQAFLLAAKCSGIEEFLAESHKHTLKSYTKLTGRHRLVFTKSDSPEVQMMVLRAKFLEAEQAALKNPQAQHNYWGALQGLISPLLLSYSAMDKKSLTAKLRTFTAQYNTKNVHLTELRKIEKQFAHARLKLKKAKHLIDRIKKINHQLRQINQTEDSLDDAEVDLSQIEAGQWDENINYQSAVALFDESPVRSDGVEKELGRSSAKAEDVQQVLIRQSHDLVEQEIEQLRYATEEQHQTINVLQDELQSRAGSMAEHELIEARLKINKMQNEITEAETVIAMLEDELSLMRFTEPTELATSSHANGTAKEDTLKEIQIKRLQQQLDVVMANAMHADMSDIVEEKIAENDKLYADKQALKMSLVKVESTLADAYLEKDRMKGSLEAALALNTANTRVIYFALEITKQNSLSDIVKCLIDLASNWNLSISVMGKLGKENVCQASQGHFSKDDKYLIEEAETKKKVVQVKNNLIIRGDGLAMVIHGYSVKSGNDPNVRDCFVILLGIAQKQVERVLADIKLVNQKVALEKVISATEQATKNVIIQCHYHNNESKLIINNLVGELNRSLSRVRLSAQEREQFAAIMNEAKDRFIVLWDTFTAIDGAFDNIFSHLKNKKVER